MTEDFATCSICMETYDLQHRIPKSLDCRHSFCAPCLTSQLEFQPYYDQTGCPSCRRPIDNVVNDLTMIDYLERKQYEKRMAQQRAMRKELEVLTDMAEKEHERMDNTLKVFTTTTSSRLETILKEKTHLFKAYTKYLLQKCFDCCSWEKVVPKLKDEMECSLHEVELSLATMKSLQENDYIPVEEFDACCGSMRAQFGSTEQNYEDVMWESYRKLFLEQLAEISKETVGRDPNFVPGNSRFFKNAHPPFT